MAFPIPVPDNERPPITEGGAEFRGLFHGRWGKRNLPEYCTSPHNHSTQQFNLWFPSFGYGAARNFVSVKFAFQTDSNTTIWFAMYDQPSGAWLEKARIQDASGLVNWGDGGATSSNYSPTGWGGESMMPSIPDATRLAKPTLPQFMDVWLVRAGANQTVMSWRYYSQVVTDSALCTNYGKCDLTIGIDRIKAFNMGTNTGKLTHAMMSAEIY